MGIEEVIQQAVLGWCFEVAVHMHQARSLVEQMWVVAGSALELEVGEDVEALSSCHQVMFMALEVLAQ
jgi:CO dehydrogenase/acetyl-CoA synthase alpha subunit